jgi:hypothetical protein
MNIDNFRHNTDLYSADLSRWPRDLVKPALELMRLDAEAKAYFNGALALDDHLRALDPPQRDASGLEEKIIARLPRGKAPAKAFSFRAAALLAPGGGLVAAALLAFFIAVSPPPHATAPAATALHAPDPSADDETLVDLGGPDDPDF